MLLAVTRLLFHSSQDSKTSPNRFRLAPAVLPSFSWVRSVNKLPAAVTIPSAAWQELMLRLFIFDTWSCRYFKRSQRSGDIEQSAMLNAAPMALLPMFRSSATNWSLLMKENDPA
ncbi:MAG: hypothetical protein AW10_01844 [Candidatus Accumulibacter appositus]|uniref:Uncharacterized protein n=1 Tax=Candidatus Accumulibacter appositus TaxID=1454003 RepID=A0A011NYI6_9PROT|nr:MAG: hypothetical protein AW10_01844 [Candidatus Accumulibacter appositus]